MPDTSGLRDVSGNAESTYFLGHAQVSNRYIGSSMVAQAAGRNAERTFDLLVTRSELLAKHFRDAETLEMLVASRPDKDRIVKRIREEVRLHRWAIRDIDEYVAQSPTLPKGIEFFQYHALVQRLVVDPSRVFDDIPCAPPICALNKLSGQFIETLRANGVSVEAYETERYTALQRFELRWRRLTGRPSGVLFEQPKVPYIEDLERKRARIEIPAAWHADLPDREERRMTCAPGQPPAGATEPKPGNDTVAVPVDECASADCRVEDILLRAGARKTPQATVHTTNYTFPCQAEMREDIFFDFGVIVEVPECGPLQAQDRTVYPRSMTSVRNAVCEALALLQILRTQHLSESLGKRPGVDTYRFVVDDLESLLLSVLCMDSSTASEVRSKRRELRETAAHLRAMSRRKQFLMDVGSTEPETHLEDLKAALLTFPKLALIDRQVPAQLGTAEFILEQLPYYIWPHEALLEITPRNERGEEIQAESKAPPDAFSEEGWRRHGPPGDLQYDLRVYLRYLANGFKDKINQLLSAGESVRTDLENLIKRVKAPDILRQWERFFVSQLQQILQNLSALFDEIAEVLSLSPGEPQEGNKRLGLMLIYRQHWWPEAYVRGKLVGHKNLPPDAEETLRRRTFVRTTRETSTVEEFSRSRQEDFSRSQKESSDVMQEMTQKFNLINKSKGSLDLLLVKLDVDVTATFDLADVSRATHNKVGEMTEKSAASYNQKREVKIVEKVESEDEVESTMSIKNLNKEITANYFYYQLLRQYLVTVELHDLRPVLLRSKELPTEAAIDDRFLSMHAHVLIRVLPPQLADDMQSTVNEIEPLARAMTCQREIADRREAVYEAFRNTSRPVPSQDNPRSGDDWDATLAAHQEAAELARTAFMAAEEAWYRARARLDRVITHVRRNRLYYMQNIWEANPRADEDMLLRDVEEYFNGYSLPDLTRGLIREGYFGQEEVFQFNGPSMALAEALAANLVLGADLIAEMSDEELKQTSLFQQLARYYGDEEAEDIRAKIEAQLFTRDPATPETYLSTRRVQIAQDALVVETMPGAVSLLEGYQMAQRFLAVERSCLQNTHLRGRIADKTWSNGEDSMRVYVREGQSLPAEEREP